MSESTIGQIKYGGTFEENLKVSQEFVQEICRTLRAHGLLVRGEDDTAPFIASDGKWVRLCDIMAVNPATSQVSFIEAKDNCRCLYYDATGQPKKYVDEKLRLLNGGDRVFIVFRENMDWVESKAALKATTKEQVLESLATQGLAEIGLDGRPRFVPYGQSLAFLLRKENIDWSLEYRVPSKLSRYRGETQYMWPVDRMLPIGRLVREVILGKEPRT